MRSIHVLVLLLLSAGTQAAIVEVSYSGTLVSVGGPLPTEFPIGESFSGSFVMNLGVPLTECCSFGSAESNSAITGLTHTSDDYTATADIAWLRVTDNSLYGWDKFEVTAEERVTGQAPSGEDVAGRYLESIELRLTDYSGTVFIDNGIPESLSLENFDQKLAVLAFRDGGFTSYVNGEITSLSIATVVPVPAAVWLFGSALAGLGWMRCKHASAANKD